MKWAILVLGGVLGWATAAKATFSDIPHIRSYAFVSPSGSAAPRYLGGFYDAAAAHAELTQASLTVTYGTANRPYAAHAILVTSAAGTASGGTGTVTIVVSGTSIDDQGTRSTGDSETIVSDITATSTNAKYETTKKWLGQITYTLTCSGGCTRTAYASTFNYGFAKYDDWGNNYIQVTDLECVGLGGASDSDFDLEFIHHKATGWTYHASAFVPGPTASYKMSTDHNGDDNIAANESFAWKRDNLSLMIYGDDSEGFLIRVTAGQNNSVRYMNCHVGISDF